MSAQWEPPKAVVDLAGTITYRCADCGERIEGEPVLWPLEDGSLMSITRAYHHDHLPQPRPLSEVTTNGS